MTGPIRSCSGIGLMTYGPAGRLLLRYLLSTLILLGSRASGSDYGRVLPYLSKAPVALSGC
jgi:hypothetical protein